MEFVRGNQIRGVTPLAPILVAANDLDDFEDAQRGTGRSWALLAWRRLNDPGLGGRPRPRAQAYVGRSSS